MVDMLMVHPSQPDNVVATTEAAFRVYAKKGWKKAKDKAEVTPENVSARDEDEAKARAAEAKADKS